MKFSREEKDIYKLIIKLGLPILIMKLISHTVSSLDSFISGYFLGVNTLTSISLATSSSNRVLNFFVEITAGVVVVAGIIRRDKEDDIRVKSTTVYLGLITSLLVTLILVIFRSPLTSLINVPDELLDLYNTYYTFNLISIFLRCLYEFLMYLSIGLGDSKTPSTVTIVTQILNVAIDAVVVQFTDNIVYLSLTTSLAYLISCFVLWLRLGIKLKGVHRGYTIKIMEIGVPASFVILAYSISGTLISRVINSYDISIINAYTLSSDIIGLLDSFSSALYTVSASICTMRISNLAFKRKCLYKFTLIVTIIPSILGVFIFYIYGHLVTSDQDILSNFAIVSIPLYLYPMCHLMDMITGMHTSVGLSKQTAICTFISAVLIRVGLVYTLGMVDFIWIMLAYPITWVLSSVSLTVIYNIHNQRVLDLR